MVVAGAALVLLVLKVIVLVRMALLLLPEVVLDITNGGAAALDCLSEVASLAPPPSKILNDSIF